MKVKVVRGKSEQVLDLEEGSNAGQLCSLLGLLIDAHITLRGNVPIPLDEKLNDGDIIKIVKVASGG
jgi:sulfur carrier protein ThiS